MLLKPQDQNQQSSVKVGAEQKHLNNPESSATVKTHR
jgi:hypothetical protein